MGYGIFIENMLDAASYSFSGFESLFCLSCRQKRHRKYFLHLLFVVFHYRLSSAEINSIMFLCSTPSRFWSRVSIVSRYLG
ncbi:MAG: hypothetical protein IKM59_07710 [Oscillospiraceae bacterium]|nr:hypothetical protein [Oscillospiraceae bacterium]